MIWMFFGCLSIHHIGQLVDYNSAEEKIANAHKAVSLAGKQSGKKQSAAQALAMQTVGRLRIADDITIDGTLQILDQTSDHSVLHKQAIWSLGELGRGLPWNEQSQRIHNALLEHLERSSSTTQAHYLLEAIGKVYCQHTHTIAEDITTAKALNAYEAKHNDVPSLLYIVLDRITSLPVLIALLKEAHEEDNTVPELYSSILEAIRFIQNNRAQLINTPEYQKSLAELFSSTMALLDTESQALYLMTIWMLSEVATDPILSTHVVDKLIEISATASETTQHLIAYALSKMTSNEEVRTYFRTHYFQQESSSSQLYLLTFAHPKELDIIQQLYGISLEPINAP